MRMPEFVRRRLLAFAERTMQRPADNIPPQGSLMRWWVTKPSKRGNIFVHRFLKSDADRARHDHSSINISFILAGFYNEDMADGIHLRRAGDIIIRWPWQGHKVLTDPKDPPCITLFIMGPTIRKWGFHCVDGSWFPASDAKGNPAAAELCGVQYWENPPAEAQAKP